MRSPSKILPALSSNTSSHYLPSALSNPQTNSTFSSPGPVLTGPSPFLASPNSSPSFALQNIPASLQAIFPENLPSFRFLRWFFQKTVSTTPSAASDLDMLPKMSVATPSTHFPSPHTTNLTWPPPDLVSSSSLLFSDSFMSFVKTIPSSVLRHVCTGAFIDFF